MKYFWRISTSYFLSCKRAFASLAAEKLQEKKEICLPVSVLLAFFAPTSTDSWPRPLASLLHCLTTATTFIFSFLCNATLILSRCWQGHWVGAGHNIPSPFLLLWRCCFPRANSQTTAGDRMSVFTELDDFVRKSQRDFYLIYSC